jgi:poly-gamma-glutamate capsule biosynthesis protein CapA/YwtB (metallophosphatase superfamily)
MNQRALEAAEEAAFGEMDNRGLLKDVGDDLFDEIKRDVAAAVITAYEAHLKAEGFVVVPEEPTEAMLKDGSMQIAMNAQRVMFAERKAWYVYRAMIAATQEPNDASD